MSSMIRLKMWLHVKSFSYLLVVEAHILSVAMQVFGMSSLESIPSNTELFPKEATDLSLVPRCNDVPDCCPGAFEPIC